MERDRIIAVVLIVGFVFLVAALLGVVAITGFILVFTAPQDSSPAPLDAAPLIETGDTDAGTGSGTPAGNDDAPATDENPPAEPAAPVCGNNKKESGEQCETDSQCSATQTCNSTCQCVNKPVEKAALRNITITKLNFWCAPDFNGKKGLAIKFIEFKNSGAAFTHDGTIRITAVTGETTDSVQTNAAFKFNIPSGKTLGLYQKDILRADAPYIFLGSTPDKTKITIDISETEYIEYEYTLKGNDFGSVGCL
ncbi:MAG TPA: EB domain-containing protein [archaeon]|nr:EB domain-containing protein [archaeon]